jgi:putative transcriptional regulator
MRMIDAKRAIECLMHGAPAVVVAVPMVEDSAALEAELRDCAITATRLGPEAEVDIRALREAMGVTQEEFALRFGLDVAALRNWEQGRTRPDTAARSLFRVIAREPAAVERALAAE